MILAWSKSKHQSKIVQSEILYFLTTGHTDAIIDDNNETEENFLWRHPRCRLNVLETAAVNTSNRQPILSPIESVDSSVPVFVKILKKNQDNFDPDRQLMGPLARSNPTARRSRNYLEFFKIFMNTGTELSTLSMGHSIGRRQEIFGMFEDVHKTIKTAMTNVQLGPVQRSTASFRDPESRSDPFRIRRRSNTFCRRPHSWKPAFSNLKMSSTVQNRSNASYWTADFALTVMTGSSTSWNYRGLTRWFRRLPGSWIRLRANRTALFVGVKMIEVISELLRFMSSQLKLTGPRIDGIQVRGP